MSEKNEIEELMDDFEFTPITKGLGFHHSVLDKEEAKSELKQQQKNLLDDLDQRSNTILKKANIQTSNSKDMGELSAFYNTSETEKIPKISNLNLSDSKILTHDATFVQRFLAWSIDITIIFSMLLTTTILTLVFASFPMDLLDSVMVTNDLLPSFVGLFFLFYFFYFSVLEKTDYSTVGKRLMGIKVIGMEKKLSLINTVHRTLLNSLSIITLGLFTLLSLQDSFSNTKVVKVD